jgi:organic radical activating enzyme
MKSIRKMIEKFYPTARPLEAGVFHYQAPPTAAFPYRLHLRIEPDGTGLLIVNASTVLHLNQTAVEFALSFINQVPEEEAIDQIKKRYNIDREQIALDYHEFIDRLQILIETPDLDPVTYLDFERAEPYAGAISAPYRLDCALTYRLSDENSTGTAPTERVKREMLSEEWQTILSKAWDAGIPHVVFTGGEPTLRPDLPEIIAFAEQLGQVSGLLTNGLRLSEHDYLHQLLNSGLDHIMLTLDPDEEQSWEALRDVLAEDIHTTVHLTITRKYAPQIPQLLDRLKRMGVVCISLSVDNLNLNAELIQARQMVADRHMQLVWDLPVPYSRLHPVALELKQENEVEGVMHAWLYVEPDGDILLGQGQPQVFGNLLSETWDDIWSRVKAA